MDEYLTQSSIETISLGKYNVDIIENSQKVFTENQRDKIAQEAGQVLEATTGVKDRDADEVKRYLFGLEDRGRVLYLFKDAEKLVGFTSWHLLNDNGELIRFNNSTVLHAGSAHILPTEQGSRLWMDATKHYLNELSVEVQPQYVEGFTQSPRLLKLMSLLSHGEIYPNVDFKKQSDELKNLQDEILPKIVLTKGNSLINKHCVVKGMARRVYTHNIYTGDEYDDLFYKTLDVKPDQGDFVHFVARIPQSMYEK